MLSDKVLTIKEQHYRYTLTGILDALEVRYNDLQNISKVNRKRTGGGFHRDFAKMLWHLKNSEGKPPSEQFASFHHYFRKCVQSELYLQALNIYHLDEHIAKKVDILHTLCEIFFSQVPICGFLKRSLEEACARPDIGSCIVDIQDFDATVAKLWKSFEDIKKGTLNCIRSGWRFWIFYVKEQINLGFDPFANGNLPHRYFTVTLELASEKVISIKALRIGSPTREDLWAVAFRSACVNPEFHSLLASCEKKKQRYLYVNLQNSEGTFLWKNEKPRCQALEELQKTYTCFYFIGLSKDSSFYFQREPYDALHDARVFKEAFWKQLFLDEKSCITFPDALLNDQNIKFEKACGTILEEVHKLVFDNKESLTVEERQDFIEIFYTFLIEYLLTKIQPEYFNISCKDSIDRGVCSNLLLFFSLFSRSFLVDGELEYSTLKAMIFAPALLVRHRVIKDDRLERLLSAARRLIKCAQNLKGREKGYKLLSVSLPT